MKIWSFTAGLPTTIFRVIAMKKTARLIASCALFSCLAFPAFADTGAGISWEELNKYEQEVLAGIKDQWDAVPPARQTQLQQAAELWLKRSIHRRPFDIERFDNWQNMSDDERKRLRKRFQKFQSLPEAERERVRRARQRYEQLTPEERRDWRKRWEAMSPEERERYQSRGTERRQQKFGHFRRDNNAAPLSETQQAQQSGSGS